MAPLSKDQRAFNKCVTIILVTSSRLYLKSFPCRACCHLYHPEEHQQPGYAQGTTTQVVNMVLKAHLNPVSFHHISGFLLGVFPVSEMAPSALKLHMWGNENSLNGHISVFVKWCLLPLEDYGAGRWLRSRGRDASEEHALEMYMQVSFWGVCGYVKDAEPHRDRCFRCNPEEQCGQVSIHLSTPTWRVM